jgi:hypothetical protein
LLFRALVTFTKNVGGVITWPLTIEIDARPAIFSGAARRELSMLLKFETISLRSVKWMRRAAGHWPSVPAVNAGGQNSDAGEVGGGGRVGDVDADNRVAHTSEAGAGGWAEHGQL